MADSQPQVVLTGDQYARQQLAKEMAAIKDSPLDRVQPGGRFIGTDGQLHDSEGRPIKESEPVQEEPEPFNLETATKAQMIAEFERRTAAGESIEVKRLDGGSGELRAEDYRAALK